MTNRNKQLAQRAFSYNQVNKGNINNVFPLLCPVRESDWIDGWQYHMIYSKSGLVEKNGVFTTPNTDGTDTVWHVTQHSPDTYTVEFVRVNPGKHTVRLNIRLYPIDQHNTRSEITYLYTALNAEESAYINGQLETDFEAQMGYWEAAINHFLQTGTKLMQATYAAR